MTSLWMPPTIFPATGECAANSAFWTRCWRKWGVPMMDESLWTLVDEFFDKVEAVAEQ